MSTIKNAGENGWSYAEDGTPAAMGQALRDFDAAVAAVREQYVAAIVKISAYDAPMVSQRLAERSDVAASLAADTVDPQTRKLADEEGFTDPAVATRYPCPCSKCTTPKGAPFDEDLSVFETSMPAPKEVPRITDEMQPPLEPCAVCKEPVGLRALHQLHDRRWRPVHRACVDVEQLVYTADDLEVLEGRCHS